MSKFQYRLLYLLAFHSNRTLPNICNQKRLSEMTQCTNFFAIQHKTNIDFVHETTNEYFCSKYVYIVTEITAHDMKRRITFH